MNEVYQIIGYVTWLQTMNTLTSFYQKIWTPSYCTLHRTRNCKLFHGHESLRILRFVQGINISLRGAAVAVDVLVTISMVYLLNRQITPQFAR